MAIRPDYNVGTVALVGGSADFTTSGASLQTAAVQAGDAIIAPSGHVLIIASVTGQNSGTLFLPCPDGAAGSALPLRIRFQPDGSRYQGAVRNLIDLLSSGNIEAFAALVGAAGLVPIFTGVGTMDLADPATFGIQDPNGVLSNLAELGVEDGKVPVGNAAGEYELKDQSTFGIQDPNGVLSNLAELGVEDGKVPVGNAAGEYELKDQSTFGIQDPNGSLGKLADLTLGNRQILHTDENGDVQLSDITDHAKTMLASPTPVISSLGYTPVNKAGDIGLKAMSWDEAPSNWQQRFTTTVTLASSSNYIFSPGAGMILVNETGLSGSVGLFLCGSGVTVLVSQVGTLFGTSSGEIKLLFSPAGGGIYYLANFGTSSRKLSIAAFRTRNAA